MERNEIDRMINLDRSRASSTLMRYQIWERAQPIACEEKSPLEPISTGADPTEAIRVEANFQVNQSAYSIAAFYSEMRRGVSHGGT
jgi:hypothetical protein